MSNVAEFELFTGYGFETKTIIGEDVANAVTMQVPAISERDTGQLPGITILSKDAYIIPGPEQGAAVVVIALCMVLATIYLRTVKEESQPFMKGL